MNGSLSISKQVEMMEMQVAVPPDISRYTMGKVIGKGAFSIVCLATQNETNRTVACKIVPKKRLSSPDLQRRFETEVHIFQQLNHEGIVRLLDFCDDSKNYYIFMEYCGQGELFQYIVSKGKLAEDEGRTVLWQVALALKYLHSKKIAHRDLKPENLMITDSGEIKLSDFGLSRYVGKNGLCETACGSPCYAAPEIISGGPYDARKSDVWSLGVIVFAMLTGQLPWTKRNQVQLFNQIKQGQYRIPNFLTPECQDMIRKMMNVDPSERLSIEALLQTPWMQHAPNTDKKTKGVSEIALSLKRVDCIFERGVISEWNEMDSIDVDLLRRCWSARDTDCAALERILHRESEETGESKVTTAPLECEKIAKKSKSGIKARVATMTVTKKGRKATVPSISVKNVFVGNKATIQRPHVQNDHAINYLGR